MDDAKRLERIHHLTANYFFWQGLRFVPMGIALLLFAFVIQWPAPVFVRKVVIVLTLVAGLVLSSMLGRYYKRSFGSVQGIPGQHARRDVVKWLIVYPLLFLSLAIDGLWKGPVFVTGPIWGAATLAYWWSTGRGRLHYIPVALVLSATAFLPTLGVVPRGAPMLNLFIGLLGGVYIVAGLLDHFELVRLLSGEGNAGSL